MPFIAPELIIQAKQMDLLTYLRNYEPYELVKFSGNTYCTRTHDSLKISNGKWIWWSRGIGGRSALDYLIKVTASLKRWKPLSDTQRFRLRSMKSHSQKRKINRFFSLKNVLPTE